MTFPADKAVSSRIFDEKNLGANQKSFLARVSTIVAFGDGLESLNAIAEEAVRDVSDMCCVHLYEENGKVQLAACSRRSSFQEHANFQNVNGNSQALSGMAWAQHHDQALTFNNESPAPEITTEDLTVLQSLGITSGMIVPLRRRGHLMGTVSFFSCSALRYEGSDAAMAERVAGWLSLIIENGQMRGDLAGARQQRDRATSYLNKVLQHDLGDFNTVMSTERALRESEQKFQSLADVAPFAIFIHDNRKFLYVNTTTCDITGYTRNELLQMDLMQLVHPESADYLRERFRLRAEGKPVPHRFEAKIRSKDGTPRWVFFSGNELEYQGRNAIISGAIDITDQRRKDEQLRLTRERIRLASESAGISTWEWDIRSNRVTWSEEGYRIFGFESGHSMEGSFETFLDRVHEDDRLRVRNSIERAVSQHRDLDIEFRLLRGDGLLAWAQSRAKMFFDAGGQPERMIGVTIDVTGTKIAEQALRESEQRFRAAFNQLAVGMTQVGLDGTLLMVNEKFCEIVGYSAHELAGRRFQEFTHPDDLQVNLDKLRRMLAGEVQSYTLEKRYIRKDGLEPWVHITSSLVRDEEGKPKYIIAAVEDVTERRRAGEALRNSEKLAATGRLAASIAHEINNPLESVTNLLYLLERNPSLDASAREYAKLAQSEVGRVAHIARQTLGFYRESSSVEPVNMSQLMDEVLELFGRKIRNDNIDIVKEYRLVGLIEAFPGEIRQVLSNLLANAMDAVGKKGSIRVRISRSRNWASRGQRGVRVTICDSGPGIPIENRVHLFEPFYTTKGSKGTGLGLWVTRGIVQKHAGTIRVRADVRPGKSWTAFSVFLPLKQKSESARKRMARVN